MLVVWLPGRYDECQRYLIDLDASFAAAPPPFLGASPDGVLAASALEPDTPPSHPRRWARWERPPGKTDGDVFLHRELLVRSLDGRRVDLVTISDWGGMLRDGGGGLCESHEHLAGLDPAVFPEARSGVRPHAPAFRDKPTVFLTARVHPGETPASFSLLGSLGLLLHPTDARAVALRRHFVFKVVPMLNPDGVARGHYRQDNFGRNLNRYYCAPTAAEQPTIYAAKQAIRMHAFMPPNDHLLASGLW